MIPISNDSRADALIKRMGWTAHSSGQEQACIETCPFCNNTNNKFYINVGGGDKDGLYKCMVCSAEGNYYQLREKLGISTPNVVSMHDSALSSQHVSPLPNLNAMYKALMSDAMADVMDYLIHERKFTMAAIEELKLGAEEYDGKKWFVIPYFDSAGKPVFYKARSVPPADKAFRAPSGREAPLYNERALTPGMEELLMVEGEADCISVISNGYKTVVGVPGANVKKAAWIEKLDRLQPKVIYLLYDRDKTGQQAAREIAARIGLDRVRNISLPDFERLDGKPGKDINEWFAAGHTLEEFELLKAEAKPFDVEGVKGVSEILQELREEIEGRGADTGTYNSPWPSLNKRLGWLEPGDVVGIIAEGKVGKTTLAMNWCDYFSVNGVPAFLFCQEMPPKRMVRKWVSYVTQTDDTPGKSQITSGTVQMALDVAAQRTGDLLFGYTRSNDYKEVFETIRQAVRRYGIKVVCFDNFHVLLTNITHTTQQASVISKAFKALAMELGLLLLLIVQPGRVQDGQIVAARNAKQTSDIEKDVDSMVCLHRSRIGKLKEADFNGFMDTEENFEPQLLCRVDLSRYAPGGTCTLFMDGARSSVRELTQNDTLIVTSAGGPIPVEESVPV